MHGPVLPQPSLDSAGTPWTKLPVPAVVLAGAMQAETMAKTLRATRAGNKTPFFPPKYSWVCDSDPVRWIFPALDC